MRVAMSIVISTRKSSVEDTAMAVSSTLLFLVLVTIDIGTRIATHRNFSSSITGGTPS